MEEDVKKCETLLGSERWVLGTQDKKAIGNLIKGYRDGEEIIKNAVKENLELKKYIRELEGKLDSSRKANELLNKTNNELRLEIRTTYSKVVNDIISKFNLGDDFIPKSRVKEKIEELNKEEKDLQDSVSDEEREQYSDASIGYGLMLIENQRTVLQELMEDK